MSTKNNEMTQGVTEVNEEVNEMSVDEGMDDLSSIQSDDDNMPMFEMPPPDFAAHMLEGVLSNFFMYTDDEGNTANIADILLMIKTSIDKNTKCLMKVHQELTKNDPK